ncbi:MAG: SET domain-containing protein-lysine N-methyltransferase [bacterium]|nr:SET domain-containing protein-lysine N-methyltransferase [bacterium]
MVDVVVKKSSIENLGLFAVRDFKKGEVVLRWDLSHELQKKDIIKLPEKEKKYVSFHEGKYILIQEPSRYINHSCDANTKAEHFCDIAVRDIKKGEEITADYTEEGDLLGKTVPCHCGSKHCKKDLRL